MHRRYVPGAPAQIRTEIAPSEGITDLESGVLPLDDGSIFLGLYY